MSTFTDNVNAWVDSGGTYKDAAVQVREANIGTAASIPWVITPTPTEATPPAESITPIQVPNTPTTPWTQTTTQASDAATTQVLWDSLNTYWTSVESNKTQLDNKNLAVEAYSMETDTELKRQAVEANLLAEEEDRIQMKKAAEDAAWLSALQEKERAMMNASVTAAKTKSDAAERELQIANDVELQKSNVAFQKLWLTMSTAAVTSAQQIYTTWVYNLSKLKWDNAYKLASLEVDVAKIEFEHTNVINTIINDSSKASYAIKKELNDTISNLNKSIIGNRLDRVEMLETAMDKYEADTKANEEELLSKINKANSTFEATTKSLYATMATKEAYAQDKIDVAVSNGTWSSLSPSEQSRQEAAAWLAPWSVLAAQKTYITKSIISAFWWLPITSSELATMNQEASSLMQSWVDRDLAVEMTIRKNPKFISSMIKAVSSWSSSGTAAASYTSRFVTDSVTNEQFNILIDKKTWLQVWAEKVLVPSTSTSTKYDTMGWLSSAYKALQKWQWVTWAVIWWIAQFVWWAAPQQTTTYVPIKPKAEVITSQWALQ